MDYQIADFIIRIKNASFSRRRKVIMPYSKVVKEIGNVLVKGGFLKSIKEEKVEGRKVLEATVKFDKRSPAISDVNIISKPSLRVYASAKNIPEIQKKGMNTIVISTSRGIMLGSDAYRKGVGGEVLFKIL
ncbi:MAG: 30S ribosomal protein S8 [Patescibacteria group bacterium]